MNNVRLGTSNPIPPLVLPVGSEKLNEHRIEYHAQKVREATAKPNIDYSAPANLDLNSLKRIPAKGMPWEGDFNETMACIVIQTSSKKAPEEATLVILKDYVVSSDGIPSRMFVENIYKDGRREGLLLGKGPHGIADKISIDHAILVVKGDVHNHDEGRKAIYGASVRFA
jgi:hypothetical protein